jgi:hypothetical protein
MWKYGRVVYFSLPASQLMASLLFCETRLSRLPNRLLWIVLSHASVKEIVCTGAHSLPCQIDDRLDALLTGVPAVRALEELHVHVSLS